MGNSNIGNEKEKSSEKAVKKREFLWRILSTLLELQKNIVFQQFYTLQNVHHAKCSSHVSPYTVITLLLTIFPMLYITVLTYFIMGSLYLFILSTFFTHPCVSASPLWQPTVLCIYQSVSVLFVHFCVFFFLRFHI